MAETVAQVLVEMDGDSKKLKAETKSVKGDLADVAKRGDETSDKIKRGFSNLAKAVAAGVAAATAAIGKVLIASVKEFAKYQQNIGGLETLYKQSADQMEEYAMRAYKTVGISANKYMEISTSFAASMLRGFEGNTDAAAKATDKAMTDMADNANKMGTPIELLQQTYQSMARGNFMMLDNLKLGYGGTAGEMARLVTESGVMGKGIVVTAEEVKNIPFNKITEAIGVVQTQMGITGTTAKEAASTITGSFATMKAGWENLLTAMGSGDKNMLAETTKNFSESVNTFASNLLPVIKTVMESIGTVLPAIAKTIADNLPGVIEPIVSGLAVLLPEIAAGLAAAIPQIVPIALPALVTAFTTLFTAIVPELPTIISAVAKAIPAAIGKVIENGDGGALAAGLAALIAVKAAPLLLSKIASSGLGNSVAEGVTKSIDKAAPAIGKSAGGIGKAIGAGLKGLVQGLASAGSAIMSSLPQLAVLAVAIVVLGAVIWAFWKLAGTAIKEIFAMLLNAVVTILPVLADFLVTVIIPVLKTLAEVIIMLVNQAIIPLVNALGGILLTALNIIVNGLTKLAQIFSGTVITAIKIVTDAAINLAKIFGATLIGSINAARGVVQEIGRTFERMGDTSVRVLDAVAGAAERIGEAIEGVIDAVIRLIRELGRIKMPKLDFPSFGGFGFANGGYVPGFAGGGHVTGAGTSTSDSIAARLSAGEFVIKASSVKSIGAANLSAMNETGKAQGGNAPLIGSIIVPDGTDAMAFSQQLGRLVKFA